MKFPNLFPAPQAHARAVRGIKNHAILTSNEFTMRWHFLSFGARLLVKLWKLWLPTYLFRVWLIFSRVSSVNSKGSSVSAQNGFLTTLALSPSSVVVTSTTGSAAGVSVGASVVSGWGIFLTGLNAYVGRKYWYRRPLQRVFGLNLLPTRCMPDFWLDCTEILGSCNVPMTLISDVTCWLMRSIILSCKTDKLKLVWIFERKLMKLPSFKAMMLPIAETPLSVRADLPQFTLQPNLELKSRRSSVPFVNRLR